ncbi:MAG: flagellar basal body protein FliL [Treponema sp.]|nr:flagellar basal body protein FliL [Treponema sp.]
MKREETRPPFGLLILNRILAAAVLALVLVLAAGTVYGFAAARKTEAPAGKKTGTGVSGEEAVFSGLGTMRVSTAGENPETVIITVAFPYDRSDGPFSEELVSRIPDFKARTGEYFGSFTAEELQQTDTAAINRGLLDRYNSLLHLGQIKELYLLEFIWL